jgi:hypothetical protein
MTIIGGNVTMMKQMFGATLLAIAAVVPLPAWPEAGEQDRAALVRALDGAKATLEGGLKASEQNGRPISAKFDSEDLKSATAQRAAIGKATMTLLTAAQEAVQANKGARGQRSSGTEGWSSGRSGHTAPGRCLQGGL